MRLELRELVRREIAREVLRHQILENLAQAKTLLKANKLTDQEFTDIVNADPTKQKKYAGWMVKKWVEGGKKEVDLSQLKSLIPTFDTLATKNKIDNKDINSYKSIEDLANKIEVVQSTGEHLSTSTLEKDVDTILSNDDLLIMSPHTHEASRKLGLTHFAFRKCKGGKDSAWCTTYKSPDHFNDYYYKNDVTFYYVKVMSPKLMEELSVAFPKRYQAMVVLAFAVIKTPGIPAEGKEFMIDGYDGKDKRLPKKIINDVISILGVKKYLVPSRLDRGDRLAMIKQREIKQYIAGGSEGDLELDNIKSKNAFTIPEELIKVNGNLNIEDSNIVKLPSKLTYIKGRLALNEKLVELPQSLKYVGRLNLDRDSGPLIKSLPENTQYGDLVINSSVSLPKVIKSIEFRIHNHSTNTLPKLLVKEEVMVSNCKNLTSLPAINCKSLQLNNLPNLKALPSTINVEELYIDNCPITSIPAGQYNNLTLEDTKVTSLPDGIVVHNLQCDTLTELPNSGIIGSNDFQLLKIPVNQKTINPGLRFRSKTRLIIPDNAMLENLPSDNLEQLIIGKNTKITYDSFTSKKQIIKRFQTNSQNLLILPPNLVIKDLTVRKSAGLLTIPKEIASKLDILTIHSQSKLAKLLYTQIPGFKSLVKNQQLDNIWRADESTAEEKMAYKQACRYLGLGDNEDLDGARKLGIEDWGD